MGGIGSGRWLRPDAKTVTAAAIAIDVRAWQRDSLLKPGVAFDCEWSSDGQEIGSMIVQVKQNSVVLSYRLPGDRGGDTLSYAVVLERTSCHFGGERNWFRCPGCGCRVARLYGAERLFACRGCQDLAYVSQRKSERDRALRQAQKIRIKLGGTANTLEPFPGKPKWMRWRTYSRLYATARVAEAQAISKLADMLRR